MPCPQRLSESGWGATASTVSIATIASIVPIAPKASKTFAIASRTLKRVAIATDCACAEAFATLVLAPLQRVDHHFTVNQEAFVVERANHVVAAIVAVKLHLHARLAVAVGHGNGGEVGSAVFAWRLSFQFPSSIARFVVVILLIGFSIGVGEVLKELLGAVLVQPFLVVDEIVGGSEDRHEKVDDLLRVFF